ncbi:MAG: carbamoyltransferase HypF [Coriobacteriia bacterium]|nr:carbamoyltransferase HypF [Coriobacteriia bacterium]
MKSALKIHVTGIVQGVGFRPFVYRQAKLHLIHGWVINSADGVHIHAEGEDKDLDSFCMALADDAPAASIVKQIDMDEIPLEGFDSFEIRVSDENKLNNIGTTLVSPDLATCDDCVKELFDKNDRRYRYPFINCTNCGPRFTIIKELPYDRCNTSMDKFKMCNVCEDEYTDPTNRRFHAQPNACFDCGPYISWKEKGDVIWGTTRESSDEIISKCVKFLHDGKIVAIKGLGGFHLACDANNDKTVARLRKLKQRSNKAFAVMVPKIDFSVTKTEKEILEGVVRPIVLVKDPHICAASVNMSLSELGVMLPYTPLQHLILHDFGGPLVMTSGNIYDNPICIDDDEAYEKLADVADAFLGNNRDILTRYDDSVVRVLNFDGVQMIRRARGYAPTPIKLKTKINDCFATGPEQKNTFCYVRNDKETETFVSQHIGDLENADVFDAWLEAKNRFEEVFKIKADKTYRDMHPEYLTSKWAKDATDIQHHYAHIRSVMYENNLEGPVAGFAFDGTGYGMDGNIWGGELLIANKQDFERFANFSYVPMPGGATAIKDPTRMAYGVLWAYDLLNERDDTLDKMIEEGVNTPMTSSVGRLFDAASALLGICKKSTYEGEAAMLLEAAIKETEYDKNYDISIVKNNATNKSTARDTSVVLFDAEPTFKSLLKENDIGIAAYNFHMAFVRAILNGALLANQVYGIKDIVLSGGCFMNRFLIEKAVELLTDNGFNVALNKEVPPNDGGISLGQVC